MLFFPTVAHIASLPDFTSTVVVVYVILGFPMETGDRFIRVMVGFAAVILPIMRIDAFRFVVLSQIEGTELCFI